MVSGVRGRRIVGPGGIVRWDREVPEPPRPPRPRPRRRLNRPTYRPSPELLAEVALYRLRLQRQAAYDQPTRDRHLADADASITGWREARECALGYHYPLQETA